MSSDTRSGGTFVSEAPGDQPWTAPENAGSSDGIYASCTVIAFLPNSERLKATNFGFAIPAGATIDGIVVEIEKRAPLNTIQDLAVRIVKGGTVGSTDKSDGASWPTVDAYTTYGSSTDLWGETWSATDINSSGFGAAIAGKHIAATSPTMFVDHIRITVYYTGGTSRSIQRRNVRRLTEYAELDTY